MRYLSTLLLATLTFSGCAQFPKSLKDAANGVLSPVGGALSNDEVITGLKEALNKGTNGSVSSASATDGFWKDARIRIPFPPDAEKMKTTLNSIGMSGQVEKFEHTLNQAAEEASKEAATIFIKAISDMSIADGFAILRGKEDAATTYLKDKTTTDLKARFRPIVEAATKKVALTSYWTPLANGYNQASLFTGGKAVNPDLDAYVTERAIAGLFTLIAAEEARIRKDPLARTTDLLRRVFGQ